MLRDLARIAESKRVRYYVIGAGARFLTHDWPHAVPGGRGTTDWDIAVRVSSWAEYQGLRTALTEMNAPFTLTAAEHRLEHRGGRLLDIVPFGGVESESRTVAYPTGETVHSALGLSECEACCVRVDLGDGVAVNVVAPPGLVVLKATAYLDRRPAMTHDVQDIDFLVATYRDVVGDAIVFDRAAEVLRSERVAYEDVGAYLLGHEVRALPLHSDAARAPLQELLEELTTPDSQAVDDLLSGAGERSAARRDEIVRRYAAFSEGLSARP